MEENCQSCGQESQKYLRYWAVINFQSFLFLPYKVNYIIKLELLKFHLLSSKKVFQGQKKSYFFKLTLKAVAFSSYIKKNANIGLSLISISGLSFLNLFLIVCHFPYYLIMLHCDCEFSTRPGWLSHQFEFILEATIRRKRKKPWPRNAG